MSVSVTSEVALRFSENQKTALLSLLADEDPAIYQVVRDKIVSFGPEAAVWLRGHRLSDDPTVRRRAREIIRHFDAQVADNQFLAFCLSRGEELDLEEGAFLLARTGYPDINPAGYRALLDGYAAELNERLAYGNDPEKTLAVINHYLYAELGFVGNEANYYDPDNSYLNCILDRRTGNPISLCLVYLLLARRLRLPIVGIGMPGHFICRYQSSVGEVFIDAFNRGKLLGKADCVKYLLQSSHGFQEAHLAPVSPRRVLLRICLNLHNIYLQLDQKDAAARLQRYLVALSN
jgi:regulator of sirC expression with transglutaminase-like and TPR domain